MNMVFSKFKENVFDLIIFLKSLLLAPICLYENLAEDGYLLWTISNVVTIY